MQPMRSRLSIPLGAALLLQAFASLVGGLLFSPLAGDGAVAGAMLRLAQSQPRAEMSAIFDFIAALGIVWLGAIFFLLLHRANQAMSLAAFMLYIAEAALLIESALYKRRLIYASIGYAARQTESAETIAKALLAAKGYYWGLSLIAFGAGAMLFYILLLKSKAIPLWIALWGLVSVVPITALSLLSAGGAEIPSIAGALALPYAPFEFFLGGYILARGLRA